MGRQLVLILAGVAVLLVAVMGVVLGGDWMSGMFSKKQETPTLMIISRQVLAAKVALNQKSMESMLSNQNADPKSKESGKADATKTNDKTANAAGSEAEKRQSSQFNILISSMEDALGGKVAEDFDASGRFRLIPQARVIDAIGDYARKQNVPRASLWQIMTGSISTKRQTDQTPAEKPQPKANGGADSRKDSETSTSSKTTSEFSQGIPDVGKTVGAQYTLTVSIGEPNIQMDKIANTATEPWRVVISAQPVVHYEIFDTRGRFVKRANKMLDKPIVQSVDIVPGEPLGGELLIAYNKVEQKMAEVAARQVLEWTLDQIAPARIVRSDGRLVINRGANDGVREGGVYPVSRESGDVLRDSDTGASLEKVRTPQGSIVIQTAQERISTATTASGGPFLKGDIVEMIRKESGDGAPAGGAKPAGGQLPSLAVNHVLFLQGGKQIDSDVLGVKVAGALASEPRVAVIPRAEFSRLKEEAAHNERASGDFALSSEEGMRQSGYLIDGECSASSRRHDKKLSIGGVSETVSSSVNTTSVCTLRATAVDGRMIGSAEGAGSSLDAAAEAAAKALLARILPVMGVAGAPSAPASTVSAPPQPVKRPAQAYHAPATTVRPKTRKADTQGSEIQF